MPVDVPEPDVVLLLLPRTPGCTDRTAPCSSHRRYRGHRVWGRRDRSSQPPCDSQSAVWPPGIRRGARLGTEIVELSCWPANSRYGNSSLMSTWYNSGGRLVVLRRPGLAAVERHVRAAVVRLNEDVRVVRIDPHVVVVAVRYRLARPRLTAVLRFPVTLGHAPQDVRVRRMRFEMAVVKRAVDDRLEVGHLRPHRTAVVRSIDTALAVRRLDQDVDAIRVGGRTRRDRTCRAGRSATLRSGASRCLHHQMTCTRPLRSRR